MKKQLVLLPNGKPMRLGQYAQAWRTILRMNPNSIVHDFASEPMFAGNVLRILRGALHERISNHDPRYGRGRKWSAEFQASLRRDAHRAREAQANIFVAEFETALVRDALRTCALRRLIPPSSRKE